MAFELDAKALRYFTAVAARGSFTLAATHLRITQPAVSRQIQAIEKAYGVRLFRRQGRNLALTEAGEILLGQANELVAQLDGIAGLMKAAATEPAGRVTVGVTGAVAELLMPEAIERCRARHPRVFIHIVQASSGELKEMLTHGQLDMALLYGQPGTARPSLKPLVDLQIGLVAPPASALRGRDPVAGLQEIELSKAAALPLIFPGSKEPLRGALEQACSKAGATPNVILESESLALTKALVKRGLGYLLIGYVGVHTEVQQGTLRFVPLASPGVTWRLSLALRGTKAPSLAIRTMEEEITAAVRRAVGSKAWQGELLI